MYEKHEMDVVPYEDNDFAVCGLISGGEGWSYDSIKPDRSDS